MNKDIVIIEDFCGTLDGTDNDRFVFIAEMLAKNNSVELITSDFCHRTKKKHKLINKYGNFNVTMLKERPYNKNICIKRFLSHYFWGKRVGQYLKKRKKPDVVYCAIPTLKAANEAAKYCKKNNIKFIIDIQDLWPEAFKMVFNVPLISNIVFLPFSFLADYTYRRADEIIGVSQTYVNRALNLNKKNENGHSVFLGTDLNVFDKNVKKAKLMKKEQGEIWLGYCGTLGASYDLNVVFNALRIYDNAKLKFIIMGTGPREEEFKKNSNGLNACFIGYIPYDQMCGVLSECDIVINPIEHGAAQSIINKHADYAAAGKPVINTQENEEYCQLINKYNMGFNVLNGNPNDLALKLKLLSENENLRNELGTNSRRCAEDLFNREITYIEIEKIIEY